MEPKRRREDDDTPGLAEVDWTGIETPDLPESEAFENGDIRPESEIEGELPEEDDDNPFNDSDEALPNEAEEKALRRDPSKEGERFGEV